MTKLLLTSSKMYISSEAYVLCLQKDFRDEVQLLPIHTDSWLVLSSDIVSRGDPPLLTMAQTKQGEAKSGPKTKPGQRAVDFIAE